MGGWGVGTWPGSRHTASTRCLIHTCLPACDSLPLPFPLPGPGPVPPPLEPPQASASAWAGAAQSGGRCRRSPCVSASPPSAAATSSSSALCLCCLHRSPPGDGGASSRAAAPSPGGQEGCCACCSAGDWRGGRRAGEGVGGSNLLEINTLDRPVQLQRSSQCHWPGITTITTHNHVELRSVTRCLTQHPPTLPPSASDRRGRGRGRRGGGRGRGGRVGPRPAAALPRHLGPPVHAGGKRQQQQCVRHGGAAPAGLWDPLGACGARALWAAPAAAPAGVGGGQGGQGGQEQGRERRRKDGCGVVQYAICRCACHAAAWLPCMLPLPLRSPSPLAPSPTHPNPPPIRHSLWLLTAS